MENSSFVLYNWCGDKENLKKEKLVYTKINFKTKKALKEYVTAGNKVEIFSPGLGIPVENGDEVIEGPHYPASHTWYAKVTMKDGCVVKVK